MLKHESFIILLVLLISISEAGITQKKQTAVEGKSFEHNPRKKPSGPPLLKNEKYRNYDGTLNNIQPSRSEWGSTDIKLAREIPADYGPSDRLNAMAGPSRPSPREISNMLCDEPETIFNSRNISAFGYVWGQFLDHDISLTPTGNSESMPIVLPDNEKIFTENIPFNRSEILSGTGKNNVNREQMNLVTAWIDGSNVYGSDVERADWLRTKKDGKMKTSFGNLLPYNTNTGEYDGMIDTEAPSMVNDGNKTIKTFVAGDVRAAEHPALTSIHTLFVREHNNICARLKIEGLRSDEEIYQMARKEVSGLIQAITFNEFLPALGVNLGQYRGYNPNVSPDIMNTFATAGYRLGHTMVADDILMIDSDCDEFGPGELDLLDVFWNPSLIKDYGIDYFLKGLSVHTQYETDLKINSVLRNFLFGDPTAAVRFGLDLASINIQRGRDHGLPDYNTIRKYYTGRGVRKFSEITNDTEKVNGLKDLYGNVDNIDLWVGLLAEDNLAGKSVGKTISEMLKVQFEKLRDGDFYYYQNDPYLTKNVKDRIQKSSLSDLLIRNTKILTFQSNVFFSEPCPEEVLGTTSARSKESVIAEAIVFPNPVSKMLQVDLGHHSNGGTINISSADGKKIISFIINSNQQFMDLDVSELKEGLYILTISENDQIKSIKFSKLD
ncbi:MAG: peroxidase family protein [Saprospiraceae bacterium]